MSYTRCDVASNGPHEKQYIGDLFPRVDIAPTGAWVAADIGYEGRPFMVSSRGFVRMDLGTRAGDNAVFVRWHPAADMFGVYWVDGDGQGRIRYLSADGDLLPTLGTFDAAGAGSQGIRDVTPEGVVKFKDATNATLVDGLWLYNWRQRGDFYAGTIHGGDAPRPDLIGISVYRISTGEWFRAYPHHVDLLCGLAENGTVAANGADPGGFVTRAEWLTRPFNPHKLPPDPEEPEEPPVADPRISDEIITRQRNRFHDGGLSANEAVDCSNNIAREAGPDWGILSKETGFFGERSKDGKRCSSDIVVHKPTGLHFDCLTSSDTGSRPYWEEKGPIDLARFVPTIDLGAPSEPQEPQEPQEPPATDPALVSRVAALEWLVNDLVTSTMLQMRDVDRRIDALEQAPSNDYDGRLRVLEDRLDNKVIVSKGAITVRQALAGQEFVVTGKVPK